jgi:hypothetical protein
MHRPAAPRFRAIPTFATLARLILLQPRVVVGQSSPSVSTGPKTSRTSDPTVLKRTDVDVQAQEPGIIFELVHIAPENAEVIAAVREFLSRPLDTKSKVNVLNGLGRPPR